MGDLGLREFLKEGSIVRTKLCDNPSWVTNIIYSINEDCIEVDIGLEKTYIDSMVMVGDTIKLKYTTGDNEYTLIGWITRIKPDFPQSITIRVHQVEKFDNKRDSYRFDVYLSSVIRLQGKDKKGIFGILVNISRTGSAFIIREEIEKLFNIKEENLQNTRLFIDVYLEPDKFFSFEGVVVRKIPRDKGIEYGVKVIDMEIENEKVLNQFLTELANQDKEFYNKRSSFWSRNSKMNQ